MQRSVTVPHFVRVKTDVSGNATPDAVEIAALVVLRPDHRVELPADLIATVAER
jgi:hypothetical protein